MYDAFVYKPPDGDGFWVDCEKSVLVDFSLHLKQYRLRSQVQIVDDSSRFAVISLWNGKGAPESALVNIADRRADWRMRRAVAAAGGGGGEAFTADRSVYDCLRMIKGVPEGPVEMLRGKAIPLEYNVDIMGGIDMNKGCYLGQELVTRTLHRGVVRNRIVPVQVSQTAIVDRGDFRPNPTKFFPGLSLGSEILAYEPGSARSDADVQSLIGGKNIGKIVTMQGNVGLAMARLESMPPEGRFAVLRPALDGSPPILFGRIRVPSWWPPNLPGLPGLAPSPPPTKSK